TGIASLKVGFNKVFGYYIEVTNPHRDRVPPDYERRQTLTGAERYVTPELKQYEAKVLGAEERIATREAELVDGLRRRAAEAIGRVQTTSGVPARLGVWRALAHVAGAEGHGRPDGRAGGGVGQSGPRQVDVHGGDARDERDPARRHGAKPRAARRDRAGDLHLRRRRHRVGGLRVPAQHPRVQDRLRDALSRAHAAHRGAGPRAQLQRRGAGGGRRDRVP